MNMNPSFSPFPCRTDLLRVALAHWSALEPFRASRQRCKRYCYGDQWSDRVCVEGRWMPEEQYIRMQGSEPLKNNLIRRLVRSVLGLYRQQCRPLVCQARDADEQPLAEVMTSVLTANRQLNRADELHARTLEEFLISGLAVLRKSYGLRHGRHDCWTDIVPPERFFFDTLSTDCRGWDVEVVGQLHDISFDTLLALFASGGQQADFLGKCYAPASYNDRLAAMTDQLGWQRQPADFFRPAQSARCRVIEIWRRERHPGFLCHNAATGELFRVEKPFYPMSPDADGAPDASLRFFRHSPERWHYYFLTPFGHVLAQGVTPYAHGSHPYVFKAYPFIDGEIHSFVADVIDQQRYTNRLITLYDWVMRSSAKGVLLVPEECIPDGSCIEDIASEWARFNGVIAVKTRNGTELPRQMAANAVNVGINELLQTQLALMEDISGVAASLQGKASRADTSGSLYRQQTDNARLSQLDLLQSFEAFLTDGAYLDMKNIQQFYDTRRVLLISGQKARQVVYDPLRMGDVELDLCIRPSDSSPATV